MIDFLPFHQGAESSKMVRALKGEGWRRVKKRPLRVSSRESTVASVCIIRAATTDGADLRTRDE